MKKTFYFVSALLALVAVSCQKEAVSLSEATSTIEFTFEDNDLSKSAFDPSAGVTLTGTETISMFYNDGSKFVGADATQPVKATPVSGRPGVYSFAAPAAADGCTWFPIMPFNYNIVRLNSTGSASYVRLSPVQFPGANTFDPSMDYLVGKPFSLASDGTGTVEGYKRLFTPLCLNITGLAAGEKIHTATLSFAQDAVQTDHASLTGTFYVNLSEDFDQVRFNSVDKVSLSNAVSAVSLEGIPAVSGAWPVWFMVKSMAVAGDVTVTVSTGTNTYVRSFTMPASTIEDGKLNKLTVNIKGSGSVSSESITQCFTRNNAAYKFTNGTASLTDCAGNSHDWTASGSSLGWSNASCATIAAQLKGSSFTIPAIAGKKVVAVRIFGHCNSAASSSGAATLTLKDGSTELAQRSSNLSTCTATPSLASLASTGGVSEFTLPGGYESMSGLTIAGTGTTLVSAITLVFANEAPAPEGVPTFTSIANADSGYNKFYLGKELVVTGENLNAVEKFTVDGIDAPVYGTATSTEAHFIVPSTITGTAQKSVSLKAIYNGGEEAFSQSISVCPFYFTKGLRIRTGSNSKSTYPAENAAEAFLLLNEGRVVSASEWVSSSIDPFALSGANTVITSQAKAAEGATATQYYSVAPYVFLTADSSDKLAFQCPSNSATQLKSHYVGGASVASTYGTPSIYFRTNVDNATFVQQALDQEVTDILGYTKAAGSAAPTGTAWTTGSVIGVQYLVFSHVQTTGGKPASIDQVCRQGFMVIRDVTCTNSDGTALASREGYVEFDLYWSNELRK